MDIRQLEYYIMVCKEENFTEASFLCDITQSGLSKQIKKLENELGYILIERNSKNFNLTREGQIFLNTAKKIVDDYQKCISLLQKNSSIKIGSMTVLAPYHFAKLIAEFTDNYPQINMNVFEDKAHVILKHINEYDFVILRSFMVNHPEKYHFIPLFDDTLCVIVGKQHAYANRKCIHLKELKDETFIFPNKGSGGYEAFYQSCEDCGFIPNVQYEFPQTNTILSFVKEGIGIALTYQKVADEYPDEGLVKIALKDELHFPISLIYGKDRILSSNQKKFINFIKEQNKK